MLTNLNSTHTILIHPPPRTLPPPKDCIPEKAKLGMCPLCFPSEFINSPIGNVTVTANVVLQPSDAVAFFGCTPPPVAYFGWGPILNMRTTEEYSFYPGTNFGNALSFRRLNTSATAAAGPFDEPALVVHTADGDAAAAVGAAFESAGGVAASAISTQALDANELVFSNRSDIAGSTPDMISMLMRVTEAKRGYSSAFYAYSTTMWPVRLYLAADGQPAGEPLAPPLMPRSTEEVIS